MARRSIPACSSSWYRAQLQQKSSLQNVYRRGGICKSTKPAAIQLQGCVPSTKTMQTARATLREENIDSKRSCSSQQTFPTVRIYIPRNQLPHGNESAYAHLCSIPQTHRTCSNTGVPLDSDSAVDVDTAYIRSCYIHRKMPEESARMWHVHRLYDNVESDSNEMRAAAGEDRDSFWNLIGFFSAFLYVPLFLFFVLSNLACRK